MDHLGGYKNDTQIAVLINQLPLDPLQIHFLTDLFQRLPWLKMPNSLRKDFDS